jgi:hypothetical protein
MIRFLEHHEIDFNKWDHCIDNSINGIIYPYSFYLDQVAPGWAAIVESDNNDYSFIMPLPVKKKWGINYIIQPLFVQQLGIFSSHPVTEKKLKLFLDSIPSRFRYINYNLNTFNKIEKSEIAAIKKNKTYELDLISTYDQLYNGFSTNTRRNLQRGKKEKVFVTRNSTPEPIIDIFRQNRGKEIKLLKESEYNTLKHLVFSGIHRGNAKAYSAYDANNNFCAGAIFFHSHNKSIMIFSGSSPDARKNGAMTAIIDAFIKDHAETNRILDFEGSNDQNLARFYAGFGSKECVYLQLEINRFPFFFRLILNIYLRSRSRLSGY